MKFVKLIAMVVSFASFAHAVDLFPASDAMCKDYLKTGEDGCILDRSMYFDNKGQCACLEGDEFFKPETCKQAMIKCEEGSEFSAIYAMSMVDGAMAKKYQGCGCVKTIKAVCPTLGN